MCALGVVSVRGVDPVRQVYVPVWGDRGRDEAKGDWPGPVAFDRVVDDLEGVEVGVPVELVHHRGLEALNNPVFGENKKNENKIFVFTSNSSEKSNN